MTSEKTIKEIQWDVEYLDDSDLSMLSEIGIEEFEKIKCFWDLMNIEKIGSILTRLKILADNNVTLNFSIIFKLMLLEESEQLRLKAIEGLWESEDRSLIPVFISLICKDHSLNVRLATANCVEKFLDRSRSIPYPQRHLNLLRDSLLKILAGEIESPELLRQKVLEIIGYFDGDDIEAVIKDAFFSKNLNVKVSAIRAMGISANPHWLSLLISDIDDENPRITVASIETVGMLGDRGEYSLWLMKYLSDEDVDVQIASVKSLGLIGNEPARDAISQFIDELHETDEHLDDLLLSALNDAIQAMDFDESPLNIQGDYKDYP